MNKLIFIIFIFMVNACTSLVKYHERDLPQNNKSKLVQNNYCSKVKKINIAGNEKLLVSAFQNSLKEIQNTYRVNFLEQSILWSLFQLAFAPNSTSPNARFQVLMKVNNKIKIYDFNSKDPRSKLKWTYLEGLNILLREFRSKRSLNKLIDIAENHFPKTMIIPERLGDYISENKEQLRSNKHTLKAFFKSNIPLKKGESFARYSLKHLKQMNRNQKKAGYIPPTFKPNFRSEVTNGAKIKCNIDFNLYSKSIYLIEPKLSIPSNTFSLNNSRGDFFVGLTTFIPNWKRIKSTYLIQSDQQSRPNTICSINNQVHLISFNSRDPGQQVFNLINYGISTAKENHEFDEFIKYPRHQFLINPPRLIYESKRGTEKQLSSLLKMNFPVYNISSLGEVWAINENENSTLILDERSQGHQSCLP